MILVTGANGLVGTHVVRQLLARGRDVACAVRDTAAGAMLTQARRITAVGVVGPATDWSAALDGVSCVVHLAARTHVLRETAADPLAEYRGINVAATEHLARAAAARGVKRLVFASSVKVNGEGGGTPPYREEDAPRPEDAYGVSKWEAEQALARVAAETGLETVVLRPPLVYGAGVKGNFLRLMRAVAAGTPLPLGAIRNRRSYIYAGNLADAIGLATGASPAGNKTYLVSDGEDLSTPDLARALAAALGVKSRIVSFPLPLLTLAATIAGRGAEISRLAGSLQVDSSRIRRELDWRPPYTLAQGLEQTAQWYRERSSVSGH